MNFLDLDYWLFLEAMAFVFMAPAIFLRQRLLLPEFRLDDWLAAGLLLFAGHLAVELYALLFGVSLAAVPPLGRLNVSLQVGAVLALSFKAFRLPFNLRFLAGWALASSAAFFVPALSAGFPGGILTWVVLPLAGVASCVRREDPSTGGGLRMGRWWLAAWFLVYALAGLISRLPSGDSGTALPPVWLEILALFAWAAGVVVWFDLVRTPVGGNFLARSMLSTDFQSSWVPLAVLGSVLIGGHMMARITGAWAREEISNSLLEQARIASAALSPGDIVLLGGSADLVQSPAYGKLREQLTRMQRVDQGIRYVYLMGWREGKVVFLAEAEGPDNAVPGEVYKEASPALEALFASDKAKAFVEGPLPDKWGVWVSALVPIPAENGTARAVFGIDMDAGNVLAAIKQYRMIVILGTALVSIIVLGFALSLVWNRHQSLRLKLSELQASLLDRAIGQINSGVVIADMRTAGQPLIYVNPAFTRMTGYRREDVLERNCRILQGPATSVSDLMRIREAIRLQETCTTVILNYRKDGSTFWNELSLYPIFTSGGVLSQYLGIQNDVSERVQSQEELKSAKEAAEQANRAKSLFLANMSHEIRTPLNGIIGSIELMEEGRPSAKTDEYRETLRSSAEHLLSLINDILDFSKIESGRIELEQIPVDLAVLMEEVFDLVRRDAGKKKLSLAHFWEADSPGVVRGDPVRLRQILLNLMGNAVKFTGEGEIRVQVGPAVAHGWEISVTDTGVGLTEEQRNRLFQPFAQADASTTRRHGGSGLGLVITQRLVNQMGGTVKLESRPGEGSRFAVELPLPVLQRMKDHEKPSAWRGKTVGLSGIEPLTAHAIQSAAAILGVHVKMEPRETCAASMAKPGYVAGWLVGDGLFHSMGGKLPPVPLAVVSCGLDSPVVDVPTLAWPFRPTRLKHLFNSWSAGGLEIHAPEKTTGSGDLESAALDILVAEDNSINQRIALEMLKRMGHHVECVHDGRLAVEAAKTKSYDIIFMDVQMPVMDGVEAMSLIRASASPGRRPYIAALTANAMLGDREELLSKGMDDYLSKPVTRQKLQQVIERALNSRKTDHLVDEAGLSAMAQGWPPEFVEIFQGFLDEVPEMTDRLFSSDAPGARGLAHQLKGSGASFGLKAFAALMAGIEKEAAAGTLPGPEIQAEVRRVWENSVLEVERLRNLRQEDRS